jgi:xanthine dehydrogenase accessory factor
MTWAAHALTAVNRGETLAMVTVVAAEGSTPREAGARMLVGAAHQSGTIGGGNLEYQAMQQARRMLETPRGWALQDYPLGPLLQQCCGGHVRLLLERLDAGSRPWLEAAALAEAAGHAYALEARVCGTRLTRSLFAEETQWPGSLAAAPIRMVDASGETLTGRRPGLSEGDALIERIDARRPRLVLFGAGHVGQAIARLFAALPFRLDWYDSRPEAAGQGVSVLEEARLVKVASAAAPGDYVLILTHNHDLDYQLTRAALGADFAYCGLIGSATKKARFLRRLTEDGVAADRLTCPIGIPGLKSKAPEVIAVAVAAQLLQMVESVPLEEPES